MKHKWIKNKILLILQAPRTILIVNPCLSEVVGKHEFENRAEIQYPLVEFQNVESISFPLRTRYETNAEIAKCANQVASYPYVDSIKIVNHCAQKRVIDCLNTINQEKFERQLGFPPNLLRQIIACPLVYIDKDLVANKIESFFYNTTIFRLLLKHSFVIYHFVTVDLQPICTAIWVTH